MVLIASKQANYSDSSQIGVNCLTNHLGRLVMYFPFCCLTCRVLCNRCTLSLIEFYCGKEYDQDRKIQDDVYHWKLSVNTLEMIILKDIFFSPIGRCGLRFISACISVKVTAHHWYLDCRCRVYGTVPRTMSLDSTDFELFHYVVV